MSSAVRFDRVCNKRVREELELLASVYRRHLQADQNFGHPALRASATHKLCGTFHYSDNKTAHHEKQRNTVKNNLLLTRASNTPILPTGNIPTSSRHSSRNFRSVAKKQEIGKISKDDATESQASSAPLFEQEIVQKQSKHTDDTTKTGMSSTANNPGATESDSTQSSPAQHKPLVVGRTKPQPTTTSGMDSDTKAALNHEIAENVKGNTAAAAPAEDAPKKKEKAPKQPKAPKATPPAAPLTPALIDLRVGHILRAINHPNADSLYVSTIAMGDPEGTEHTQVDEETGKVVRTVCSGLVGFVPLEDMQNRKVVVVANLKPVNMRSIKSAAMVLAASPKTEEGADPHAPDRVVELVSPPEGSEAGEKVFFEGWPYGDGRGPEKQLNPKKKQWEAIQPGFYTTDECVVGFDSSRSELAGAEKGDLNVDGKGPCTVKSLKGAVVSYDYHGHIYGQRVVLQG